MRRYAALFSVVVLALAAAGASGPLSPARVHAEEGVSRVFLPITYRLSSPRRQGEVLRLDFSETQSATAFRDTSPMGNDARCHEPGCPQSGAVTKSGVSIQLRDRRHTLWVPDAPSLRPGAEQDMSIEQWVLPTSVSCASCPLVVKQSGNVGYALRLGSGSGGFHLELDLGDGTRTAVLRSAEQVTLNRWHHIAATVDRAAGVARLYLDGSEVTYARQDPIAQLGALATSSDMTVGGDVDHEASFQGLIDQLAVYDRALSSVEIADAWHDRALQSDPWIPRWNSQQIVTVLAGFGVTVVENGPMTSDDWRQLTPLAAEATANQVEASRRALIMSFATAADQAEALDELAVILPETERSARLIVQDNVVVWIQSGDAAGIRDELGRALANGMPASVMDAPQNTTRDDFEHWGRFYPTDRGQKRDPVTGRSQRTFDRWETPTNKWLFGQATWLYQDPRGGDAPPPAMPSAYRDEPLSYYYHYHCEKETDSNRRKDCLNWQIYIELLTEGDRGLSLDNWARGGWQGLGARTPRWEVYFRPDTFTRCDRDTVRAEADDATMLDPATKAPLSFRLPSVLGAYSSSPEVCMVVFDSYRYEVNDVTKAEPWRTITTMLGSAPEPSGDRSVAKAENRTYRFHTSVRGDRLYVLRASETYWMREFVPDHPLTGGMQRYWFGTWGLPPEDHSDSNDEDRWADLQWCHIETSQGPPGLGALVCEP